MIRTALDTIVAAMDDLEDAVNELQVLEQRIEEVEEANDLLTARVHELQMEITDLETQVDALKKEAKKHD